MKSFNSAGGEVEEAVWFSLCSLHAPFCLPVYTHGTIWIKIIKNLCLFLFIQPASPSPVYVEHPAKNITFKRCFFLVVSILISGGTSHKSCFFHILALFALPDFLTTNIEYVQSKNVFVVLMAPWEP